MNIGIVTTWFERGAAYVSKMYAEELVKENNVFIYARGEKYAKNDPNWDKEYVHWGKRSYLKWPTAIDLRDFRYWIIKNKINVVFFNEQHWWPILLLCNDLNLITGAYIDYYTEETVPLFANYDFLICNTQKHYSVFNWHPQCYYIPWGTNINLFRPSNFSTPNPEIVTFFHSAGQNPLRKGTDHIINAIENLENSKLIIHTESNLTSYFPSLTEKIAKLINLGKLEVIEKTVTAPGLYHTGDVYVYPTRLEGIGLTIPEALACGLPVITSNSAPINEFIIDGLNGKLIDIERFVARKDGYYWPQCIINSNDLFKKMSWFINNNEQVSAMKIAAREYAVRKLDWTKNSENLNNIFNTVTKKTKDLEETAKIILINFENNRPFAKTYKTLTPYHYLQNLVKRIKRSI